MLEVGDLSVAYGAHRALEGVSVRVAPGEICVILGANGAGKSTLLKAVAGMVAPRPGARIRIGGRDITGLKPHRIVAAGVALVPEGRGIFGDLTVAENLQLGAYGRQARASEASRRAQVLELFPRLGERRGQVARTMSGGEQQMVAIGRALMSNPSILMLDEPSLGLSPLLTRELFRSLRRVRDSGVGILLVEQNARQSLAIADRGYLLENGHVVGEDRADRLAGDPAVQAAYLGGAAARHAPAAPAGHPLPEAVPPQAPSPPRPAEWAASLAHRAAEIQRRHLEQLRGPQPAPQREPARLAGHVNGKAYAQIEARVPAGAAAIRHPGAAELSRMAGDLARSARERQAGHLAEIRRNTSIWTLLSHSAFEEGKR